MISSAVSPEHFRFDSCFNRSSDRGAPLMVGPSSPIRFAGATCLGKLNRLVCCSIAAKDRTAGYTGRISTTDPE
jgi:hypothetical protein